MSNEYRIAKGWRIFLYISMSLLAALFSYLGVLPFIEPSSDKSLDVFLLLLSMGSNAFIIWGLLELRREKFVMEEDRLVQVSAFRTKELPTAVVKGFTLEQNYVVVHPTEKGFPKIKISNYTGGLEELKEHLATRFRNLDQEAYEAEAQQLLEDETLGGTTAERELQLQQVRKLTRMVNSLAIGSSLWLIFFPQPYELAIYVGAVFVPLVLLIVHRYKGLVRVDENPKSAHPNLATAFIMPPIALGLRSLLDYSILQYSQLWIWISICTAVLFGLTLFVTKEFKTGKDIARSLLLLLFLGAFSYGALVQFNCMQDESVTQVYRASVLGKSVSSGKHTSYYLELEPWGPQTKAEEVSVSQELYNRVEKGQLMQVYLKKGRLDFPWFFISE